MIDFINLDDKMGSSITKIVPEETSEFYHMVIRELSDIALSLRVLSERSKVVKVGEENSYKAKYFARSDEKPRD